METKPTPASAPDAEGKDNAHESGNVIPFRPRSARAASQANPAGNPEDVSSPGTAGPARIWRNTSVAVATMIIATA